MSRIRSRTYGSVRGLSRGLATPTHPTRLYRERCPCQSDVRPHSGVYLEIFNRLAPSDQRPSNIPRYSLANAQVLPNAAPFGIRDSIRCPTVGVNPGGGDRKSDGSGVTFRPFRLASRVALGRCQAEVSSPICTGVLPNFRPRFCISSEVFLPPTSSIEDSGTPSLTSMSREVSAGSTPVEFIDCIRWPVQRKLVAGCR